MSKLSPKQQRFVDEYLIDLNATQAYIRAGYSPKGARTGAARLLAKVHIQEAVAKAKKKVDASKQWDAAWVRDKLQWLAQEAADRGQLGVLRGTLDTMSRVEAMQTTNINGTSPIMFNIKTGKK